MRNDCTVVILSFNVKKITDECIKYTKIAANFSQKKLQTQTTIIVVDNGSTDGTIEMIKKKHPDVTLIDLPKNVGPACGYNAGMKRAKTPFILLINSDTFLHESTLYDSLRYMIDHPACDVVTGKVNGLNEPFIGVGGHLPTPFKTIRWLLGLESIPFLSHFMKRIYRYEVDFSKDQQLEWIPTCFFFFKKQVFDKTKGCDEKIFFYGEDIEWCKRIADLKMSIYYTPSIQAIHLGGASTRKKSNVSSVFLLQTQIDGMRQYYKRHYPQSLWLIDVFLRLGFRTRGFYYIMTNNKKKAYAYNNILIK